MRITQQRPTTAHDAVSRALPDPRTGWMLRAIAIAGWLMLVGFAFAQLLR